MPPMNFLYFFFSSNSASEDQHRVSSPKKLPASTGGLQGHEHCVLITGHEHYVNYWT